MNVKRVFLCWSVAVSFLVLFTTGCARRDDRNFTAAIQSPIPAAKVEPTHDQLVVEQILARINAANAPTQHRAGGEPVYANAGFTSFYRQRLCRAAWSDQNGPFRQADDLVNALHRADREFLRPKDYHLVAIENLLASLRADIKSGLKLVPDRCAELDLLLTDAFLLYGSHLQPGRVNPETLKPNWVPYQRSVELAAVLENALASDTITATLAEMAPVQPGFQRLREALASYRELASQGGWPSIPDGPPLKRGDRGSSVATLRKRLSVSNDLGAVEGKDATLFDEALEEAVKQFQRRHGLKADGAIGPETRAELNVSAENRVEQLGLNLERWRWLPQDFGRRYILVNIPAFNLEVVEDEALVMDMRVVVGQIDNTTPFFNDTVRYLVLNPYWNVPRSIAVKEMLPLIKRDRSYLARERLRVFKGWGPEGGGVNPETIDWSAMTPDNFNFRLRQDSGPGNALGRIKFVFLNKFKVYLHDTPTRNLFQKKKRTFSHGCIRIEHPIELAEYLLRKDPGWNREALQRALAKAVNKSVLLPETIPIYLVYWTAWADKDGTVQFRPDVYGLDAPMLDAIRGPVPGQEHSALGRFTSPRAYQYISSGDCAPIQVGRSVSPAAH